MSEEKKETAIRRLHIALKKRFQGQAIKMPWAEMEGFLRAAETVEMTNIFSAYDDGYTDCENGIPNQTKVEADESNTKI
jgi:hypothetical protein